MDTAPAAEELTNLVGKSLYEVWDQLVALMKTMTWSIVGTTAERRGNMNTNTAAAEKRCARSMRGKTVSGL